MTRPIKISVIADADKARREVSSFGTTLKRTLGAGLTLAAGAGITELLGSINRAASDAQQSVGASESVFKQYADTVIERSKSAADAVGLSANEYRELANVSGAMLKNAGTPLKRVTDLTDKLTRRAADLAATYGGTTRDAIESVNSLLRGEADPIERYGVSIKQSDISARLAAKGLDKLTGSAKKQAEQQARLELLFQQTKDAAGQFAREADTAQGQQQRWNAELEDAKAAIGTAFLPVLTDLTKFGRREVVPMLEDFATWLGENQDEIRSTAAEIGDNLLPVLKTAGDVFEVAVDAAKALPEPLRGIALQAGLAALALPKLSAATTVTTGRVTGMVTQLRNAETRTASLASAARTAAGVGGLVALAQGAGSSNEAVRDLTTTLGAAGAGFAVGGPWGALVGGVGGLLWSLADGGRDTAAAVGKAGQAAKDSTATWQNYAQTLDDVSGATTKATRAMVIQSLQEHDLLSQANELGLSKRTIVDGILGEKDAREQLAFAIRAQKGEVASEFTAMADANGDLSASEQRLYNDRMAGLLALEKEIGKLKDSTAAKAEEIAIIKKIPEAVVTQVQTPGAVKSAADIAALAAQYRLTPKQILTVIKMSNVKTSKDEVQALKKELIETGNVKPKDAWANMFGQGIGKAKKNAQTGTADINRFLLQLGDVDSKVADGKFGKSLRSDMRAMKGDATSGGAGIGDGLGGGMYGRMELWIGPIRAKGVAMGKAAVDGAKEGAATKSPSRETIWVGRMLGEGLAGGMDSTVPGVGLAGRLLARSALSGLLSEVAKGSDEVEKALDALTKKIERAIKGKNDTKREKRILKGLKDEYAALRAASAAQEAANTSLEDAKSKLEAATQAYNDYTGAIRDSIKATGDVTQLGRQDDGTVSLTALLEQLDSATIKAEAFQANMVLLAERGLSQDQVERMLAAGPEAAGATAEAIKLGGTEAVQKINEYGARLAAAGDTLAADMAARYGPIKGVTYAEGVAIAQNLVLGMQNELARLTAEVVAASERLAEAIPKSVKKKLKIKSPSRVFEDIGKNVTDGLTIGIDDTRAARAGVSLAQGLTRGFGTPALDAVASLTAAGGQRFETTVRLSAHQISQLQRGREIIADIDYALDAGVLRSPSWK